LASVLLVLPVLLVLLVLLVLPPRLLVQDFPSFFFVFYLDLP
jgi:hypothetical protein